MPLKLYRRGKIYHYRGTVAGNRLRGSCRTAVKEIAERIKADLEQREWKGRLDGPASVLTFAQAASLYRGAQKSDRHLARVEDYWKDTPVKEITAGAVRQAALTLYPKGSGATRNRQAIVPTQAVINHAAELEYCPRVSVKKFPVETKVKEPASLTWVQDFMSSSSPHLGALACCMFMTGVRISEALNLTWKDVDLGLRRVVVRQTKTGTERRAHLPPLLVAALANIPGDRDGLVFGYASRTAPVTAWKAAIARAGIKPLTFHSCRHGFATALLQAGVDVVSVAKLGGWSTPAHVFSTYGHAAEDDTVTDRIGTPLTQSETGNPVTKRNQGVR
jgi:integrase